MFNLRSTAMSAFRTIRTNRYSFRRALMWLCVGAGVLLVLCISFLIQPPFSFPAFSSLEVEEGMTVEQITVKAKELGYVRSRFLLYAILIYQHDPRQIYAGKVVFNEPENVFAVAERLASRESREELIALTIPEGTSAREIAMIAEAALVDFDTEKFLELALPREGYLFPDTYFVPPDFSAADLAGIMVATYAEKTAHLADRLAENKLTEYEVLTLASIIEREARTDTSMRLVSGIFHNRLSIDMALQADASIGYVLGKPLSELTPEDLTQDSPYNTYTNRGLPPTPIGNPGLSSILAVLEPTPSDYFYYITGQDGTFYYARTFDEHRNNIALYLR